MQFNSVDALLDFAIKEEEEAAAFYSELSSKMQKPYMKKVFEDFAKEEMGHKAKLLGVKEGKYLEPSKKKIMDLKIGDFLVLHHRLQDPVFIGFQHQQNIVPAYFSAVYELALGLKGDGHDRCTVSGRQLSRRQGTQRGREEMPPGLRVFGYDDAVADAVILQCCRGELPHGRLLVYEHENEDRDEIDGDQCA